jgi:dipeptidyl aminopeptidase/acylaminoacyl peptidase
MDAERIGSHLAVLGVAGGEPSVYCTTRGTYTKARWLPDGSGISFLGASAEGREPAASSLYVCTGEGATPVNLTEGKPFTVAGYQWLPDEQGALLSIIEKNSRYLVRFDTANRQITRVSDAAQVVSADVSLARDSKMAACVIETPKQPPDVFFGPIAGPFRRMTRLNPALEDLTYGEAEDFTWKADDGLEITGVLIKPVGYQAGRSYPLIVQVHGGPENADLNGFQIVWGQFFAAHGYAVLFPNYRGSIGRGVEYTVRGNRDFGGKDFQDIMAGVDELIRLGIADPDRMGIGGWSYGGFMSAWAPTQTERFKASVMGVGVSNWYSLMGQTPLPLWTVQVHFETWPYDHPEAFRRPSPIEFVKNVRTPILILHGEGDPMIPLSQAREYFRALRHYDVPVELVVYPREGHGLREPVHRKRAYARILAWYDRYVKNALPAQAGKQREVR